MLIVVNVNAEVPVENPPVETAPTLPLYQQKLKNFYNQLHITQPSGSKEKSISEEKTQLFQPLINKTLILMSYHLAQLTL